MLKAAGSFRRGSPRASLLLLVFLLFRAYVPEGFMPASGVPFALQLCPAAMSGMPTGHHHHGAGDPARAGDHADFPVCPFGSAAAAGPTSHRLNVHAAVTTQTASIADSEAPPVNLRPQRTHQPRAPPLLV